ncbi:MAG: response regulator transcription factor [Candidatus Krumholzibacteriota bacterium]|nr:response regulator transcription factor [Candidatus Krumholzibacteriota bacterium]
MNRDMKVLLIEDHAIVRQGLRRLLEERGVLIVGEAEDGRRGVEMALEMKPDVVVMDISLPLLGGIDATRKIKKELPDTRIIMLTIHDGENYIYKSLDAGANAYMVKERATEDLIAAIEAVTAGEIYLSPNFSPSVLDTYRKSKKAGKNVDDFSRLTNREREILQLIAEGFTSKEIGEQLFISVKTVENHRANIMSKLDIHDTAGLVRYAIKIGLIE